MTLFRGGCTSSRVTSWCTGRLIAVRGCRAPASGGRAQGHTEECRIRVEGELKKTEERKARLRAAASRVGDAPTGHSLKRVRFAADRVEDDAETPEATSASAPSSLPAEDATTNSLPAHSSEAVLPASAVEVRDQVMNEKASGALDAAVRLSMKRSGDSYPFESEAKRLHVDHSTRDVVRLLDDSDVNRAVGSVVKSVIGKRRFLSMVTTGTEIRGDDCCLLQCRNHQRTHVE